MSQTFELWERVFAVKNFDLTKDLHFVSADEIKNITKAEPRIMAKMDNSNDLPPVFKRNGYFLLPVKNGYYAIVRGDGFHLIERQTNDIPNFISRIKFNLTTAGRGLSEMQFLDYSFNSGALESILGCGPLYQSIRGREFTKAFSFNVNKTKIDTSSVQIEVDSGLEGQNSIILLEAKVKTPEDFIIRQLFYPYNHYRIISPDKKIIPIFFTYEPKEKSYNFWIYEFTDQANYNSIKLKEKKSLRIINREVIELKDILPKKNIIYKDLIPQANDLDKVIELVFKVNEGINNYKDVAKYFDFDERQSSYYREASEALGLVVSEKGKYLLTDIGKKLITLSSEERNIYFVKILSEFSLIKSGLEKIKSGKRLTRLDLMKYIKDNSKLTGSTISRRASSLFSWYKWISENTGLFNLKANSFISNKK